VCLEEVATNRVTGNEGWRTPDESWLDMEAPEDGETFFVNMVLKGKNEDGDIQDRLSLLNVKRNTRDG
jgi:hypothetical protein